MSGSRPDGIRQRASALGEWFHNIDLDGVKTAPDHFLNDYPNVKWRRFQHAIRACSISAAMRASIRSK
jgi:tRNA (mo5U34)-methyltransferase